MKNLKAFAISVIAILALFGAVVGGFYTWRAYKAKKEKARLFALTNKYLWLHADGGIAIDSADNVVSESVLKTLLVKYAGEAGYVDGYYRSSNLWLHIRTDREVYFHYFGKIYDVCTDAEIYKINIAERGENKWYCIYLPNPFTLLNTPRIICDKIVEKPIIIIEEETEITEDIPVGTSWEKLGEKSLCGNDSSTNDDDLFPYGYRARIKLLWCKANTYTVWPRWRYGEIFEEYVKKKKNGHVVLKVDTRYFSDFAALYKHLEKCKATFKPPQQRPETTLPVIIDVRNAVPMKYLIHVLRVLDMLDIKNYTIAAPEIPY
jgi:biopolymer transport protein ExbD